MLLATGCLELMRRFGSSGLPWRGPVGASGGPGAPALGTLGGLVHPAGAQAMGGLGSLYHHPYSSKTAMPVRPLKWWETNLQQISGIF